LAEKYPEQVAEKSLGVLRPFDSAQGRLSSGRTEREFEMIKKIPFMLRLSKHSVSFFRGSGVAI
jgi:hypothetical protein